MTVQALVTSILFSFGDGARSVRYEGIQLEQEGPALKKLLLAAGDICRAEYMVLQQRCFEGLWARK